MAKRSRKGSKRSNSTASRQQDRVALPPEPLDVISTQTPAPADPSHHFRILRPSDLVVLDIVGYGLEHALEDGLLVLRPASRAPRLEVRYTFQNLVEKAEIEQANPDPLTPVPIPARAAYGTRLVFTVPDDERIEYTIEGVLAAISRLPLKVAPLATPRVLPRRFAIPQLGNLVVTATLPGGIQLYRTDAGLVLGPPGRGQAPQASGARALISTATGLRTARTLLSSERGINLSGIDLSPGKNGFERVVRIPDVLRRIRQSPRAPRANETAIEAPFRLILSPSSYGGFAHATTPRSVPPDPERFEDPERVELWHSRLGVRHVDSDGAVTIDEGKDPQKAVRAIWARDQDEPAPDLLPYATSLKPRHRESLVRQSADPALAPPVPVDADRLYLSSLGAWLELHGRWNIQPYAAEGLDTVLSWDHEAAVGRDNFVRVEEPYYFFPFGHRCKLVTITERKIKEKTNPQARLYQRAFLAVEQPIRSYNARTMPFQQVRIRPLLTPDLDVEQPDPNLPPILGGSVPGFGEALFWPTIDNVKYKFVLDCLDRNGRRVVVQAAMLAVNAKLGVDATEKQAIVDAYELGNDRDIDGAGQMVAVAESTTPGDTAYETVELRFTGDPGNAGDQISTPHLEEADIVVPAMRHLAPSSSAVTVHYAQTYLDDGFAGSNADPQVLLELNNMTSISFGGGTGDSGGFVQPDLPVRGLSRKIGVVGDINSVVSPPNPAEAFDPDQFLAGVLPKLFGLFELTEILSIAGLDKAPSFITDQLDKIAALLADLEDLDGAIDRAVDRLVADAAGAPTTALRDQAEDAKNALEAIQASYGTRLQNLIDAVDDLLALDAPSDLPAVTAAVSDILDDLGGFVTDLQEIARTLPMPPTAKAELERLTGALQPLLAAAAIVDTIEAIANFVNGIDPSNMAVRARFEWRPTLNNYPDVEDEDDALFFVDPNGFVLSVEARASGSAGVGADVLAELSDFGLNLFPGEPLIKIRFDRLAFRASTGRKPEVDVVFTGIEWQGILSFIETLQELIPFDGFSDPPYVDVSTEGITAGFDLGLPAVSVGVFSLENISLGADVRVPFLGDAVTVGFNFCTREKPFRLTVMMIGGGGFVGIRLSPKGLVVLEMSLEAGASLSIDLGVASGSVSIMVGIYMKLEADAGQLTGYFRIRGEVDVLGIISASITLELSLTYEFATGKMVGRASITIEISVFIFSGSVEVSCERRLAGSNGDPTLAQILGVSEDGTPLTDVPPAWSTYCGAFAGS